MGAEARWALPVCAYFAAQALVRLLVGPALELDEAEAFWHARGLAWGYGAQPPLYFWLQWGLFQVLGEGLPAVAALKALLLAGTLLALLRVLAGEAPMAAAGTAALSLGLLPQVAWEGQRALSHSVLALLLAVLAAGAFVRAMRTGGWGAHLLLGAVLGLGTLSKLNFPVWPAGLLVAALVLPEWRARLRPGRLAAAGAVAALLVLPTAVWMARNPELAAASVEKLALDAGGPGARLRGTAALAGAVAGFLALPALVLGAVAGGARARPVGPPPVARLLLVASMASLGLIWLGMLATGATGMRERWLLPVAWAFAPAGALALWPVLSGRARRGLAAAAGGAWLLAAAGLPYAGLVDPGYRGADFGPLVERLRGLGAPDRPVLASGEWVAGNLALAVPGLDLGLAGADCPRPEGAAVVVTPPDGACARLAGRPLGGADLVPLGPRAPVAAFAAP